MHHYGSLSVLIGPSASIWVLMDPYRSLFVPMDSNGSVWVLIIPRPLKTHKDPLEFNRTHKDL